MTVNAAVLPGQLGFTVVAALLAAALLLDHILGEPRRFHPLIGFGNWANRVEKHCRRLFAAQHLRLAGIVAWGVAVLPIVFATWLLLQTVAQYSLSLWLAANVVLLYLCIGGNSLLFHANAIYRPLQQGNIHLARQKVALIVSRETASMDERQITSAAVESVLENGNDALFAALFWFVLAGAPGAVLFRLVNTLDAMWGYKNERYFQFGYTAAHADDLLGWLPARLTALTYALQGNFRLAVQCWRQQAGQCASPNGGVVMCAGAGALNTRIGGPAVYHGIMKDKIYMGCGELADCRVIPRANRLVKHGAWIWVSAVFLMSFI